MPLVRISIFEGWSAEDKCRLHDVVHAALVGAFRIPENDVNQRIDEYAPQGWRVPPGRSQRAVTIEILAFPGRSREAKQALYTALVDGLAALGVPRREVMIVLLEPPLVNWGLRGGVAGDTIDFGFPLDV